LPLFFFNDALGRVIEQKVPVEEKNGTVYYSVKKMWYDGNGNVVKEKILTNSAGESDSYSEVNYRYDNRNRLVMTESNDGETANYTQYYYDAKGNVLRTYTGLTSPLTINGLDDVTAGEDTDYAVTKYTYDKFGRVTQVQDALGNSETNTYDAVLGLLMSTTDRNGQTFNFTYDGMGNLTSKALADGTNAETATYGLTGQLLSKENGQSTISYTYNNKGQLVSESDTATGATKTYTYDANGNRTGFTLTRNGTAEISQTYAYDKLNRLVSVSENGAVIATYIYDNKGNRISTVSNGITTEYAYNLANMLTSQTSGNKLTESYTYYLNGNQKSKTSNGQTTNYVYDKMNRLTRENDTVYTFDDFGNRKTMTEGEATTTYTYDLNNRLLESNEVMGDAEVNAKYFYDANGNQTTKAVMSSAVYDGESAGHTVTGDTNEYIAIYDYNCYNQLVGVDTNGVVSSYAYLPDGMRLSKTVGTDTITFVYDGANIVEEITAGGVNKYYRGIEIIKNDDNVYYLYNGQGDVAILTDNAGNTVASYIFDAYGNTDSENSVYNCFGYRGEYADFESGLIYLRARMYDPSTGRFINEDPIRDGLNWYVYCGSNPVMFVDVLGLAPTVEEAAYMAEHIYKSIPLKDDIYPEENKRLRTVSGWRLIDVWTGRQSMKMGIYIRENDDYTNPSEYTIVFKGTDNIQNWQNNVEAFLSSCSADLWDAINYSKGFVSTHSQEITFVGHSKGGGEAIAAAAATNKNAITFNAANFNFSKYGVSDANILGTIDNHYIEKEALSSLIGTAKIGTEHWHRPQIWHTYIKKHYKVKAPNPWANHSMKAIISALNE